MYTSHLTFSQDPSAKIGSNCRIGPNVTIGPNLVVEEGICKVTQHPEGGSHQAALVAGSAMWRDGRVGVRTTAQFADLAKSLSSNQHKYIFAKVCLPCLFVDSTKVFLF